MDPVGYRLLKSKTFSAGGVESQLFLGEDLQCIVLQGFWVVGMATVLHFWPLCEEPKKYNIYIYIPKNHGISKQVVWRSQKPAITSKPSFLEGPMILRDTLFPAESSSLFRSKKSTCSLKGLRLLTHQMFLEDWVVVSNIFYFHPYLGKIPILTNIFQRGWNHQLEEYHNPLCSLNPSASGFFRVQKKTFSRGIWSTRNVPTWGFVALQRGYTVDGWNPAFTTWDA